LITYPATKNNNIDIDIDNLCDPRPPPKKKVSMQLPTQQFLKEKYPSQHWYKQST
jgi:hypothetical protein